MSKKLTGSATPAAALWSPQLPDASGGDGVGGDSEGSDNKGPQGVWQLRCEDDGGGGRMLR